MTIEQLEKRLKELELSLISLLLSVKNNTHPDLHFLSIQTSGYRKMNHICIRAIC